MALFALPVLIFVAVRVVGQLYLPEIILLLVLPGLLFKRGRRLLGGAPRTLLLLGALWLFSQILTDVVHDTPFVDWSRGWARIGLFLVDFSALYLLLRGDRGRVQWFMAGFAVGQILTYLVAPSESAVAEPWKFGYGEAVTLLAVVLANSAMARRTPTLGTAVLASVGVLNLVMGSRSLFLVCSLTAVYLFVVSRRSLTPLNESETRRAWPVLAAVLVAALALAGGYGYAAANGWLGRDAAAKYSSQAGGEYGVLLGGRVGLLASSQAIADSPLLGHGSWAKDWKYQNFLDLRLAQLGYGGAPYTGEGVPPIPSHSYLFQGWVEAGVIGAVFWAWMLFAVVRAVIVTYRGGDAYSPLFAFAALLLAWNVLFSPFAAEQRFSAAVLLAVVLSVAYAPGPVAGEVVSTQRCCPLSNPSARDAEA